MMMSLLRLQKLSAKTRENYFEKFGEKLVWIFSKEWGAYWRQSRCGYTEDFLEAGVFTLSEAYSNTSHCGTEKQIWFKFADEAKVERGCGE